jgi:hypothetical protein
MIGYDIGLLTPAGPGVEHHRGQLETDGPWLIVRDTDGLVQASWPSHAVYAVKVCDEGVSCRARNVRPTDE